MSSLWGGILFGASFGAWFALRGCVAWAEDSELCEEEDGGE